MEVRELIERYIQGAKAFQLATAAADSPWVCNVWFVTDEALRIYWFSSVNRRHSRELEHNPRVAGAICLPQTPMDKVRGVQFEGVAEPLTDEAEIHKARELHIGAGTFSAERIELLSASADQPHKFYRVIPSLFVLFDADHFPESPRQEYIPKD